MRSKGLGLILTVAGVCLATIIIICTTSWHDSTLKKPSSVVQHGQAFASLKRDYSLSNSPELTKLNKRQANCTFYSCWNVYNCKSIDEEHIGVYVHQFSNRSFAEGFSYLENQYGLRTSKEFVEILSAVKRSKFIVERPEDACVHILPIDLTNELALPATFGAAAFDQILVENGWPFGNGENFLILNFILNFNVERSRILTELPLRRAMIASAALNSRTFRQHFDLVLPFPLLHPSGNVQNEKLHRKSSDKDRKVFLLISQTSLPARLERFTAELVANYSDVLRLHECTDKSAAVHDQDTEGGSKLSNRNSNSDGGSANGKTSISPVSKCVTLQSIREEYQNAEFCLLFRSNAYAFGELPAILESGCIPVVVANWFVPPLEELATEPMHNRILLHILETEAHLHQAYSFLNSVKKDPKQLASLRRAGAEFVRRLGSIDSIVNAALRTVSNRIHPTRHINKLFDFESRTEL